MRRGKALLLNPPGKAPYIRDYYCSKISKSGYLFHPIDLLMMSGRLSEEYELVLMDCIVDRVPVEEALEKIKDIQPDVIISQVGSVSWDEDRSFLKRMKQSVKCLLLVTGDVMMESASIRLSEEPYIDAALLDFSNTDVSAFLSGRYGEINNMVYRLNGDVIDSTGERPRGQEFELPIPRHDIFRNRRYHFSFSSKRDFATVLTDFGCPYNCSFCIMSNIGVRFRTVVNVLEELRQLGGLGIEELFFADQTFGAVPKRNIELCRAIIDEKLSFGWSCFSRVDVVDEKTLRLWKEAGCHTIIFGVETANEDMLKTYRKKYTKQEIKTAFELCRKIGIQTVGTFILGLPEETRQTAEETIEFAKQLDCDFFSFNFAVPRFGTELREELIEQGLASPGQLSMDQSGLKSVTPSKGLTADELKKLRRDVIIHFYLRPRYLLRRIFKVKSAYQLWNQVREGYHLIISMMYSS